MHHVKTKFKTFASESEQNKLAYVIAANNILLLTLTFVTKDKVAQLREKLGVELSGELLKFCEIWKMFIGDHEAEFRRLIPENSDVFESFVVKEGQRIEKSLGIYKSRIALNIAAFMLSLFGNLGKSETNENVKQLRKLCNKFAAENYDLITLFIATMPKPGMSSDSDKQTKQTAQPSQSSQSSQPSQDFNIIPSEIIAKLPTIRELVKDVYNILTEYEACNKHIFDNVIIRVKVLRLRNLWIDFIQNHKTLIDPYYQDFAHAVIAGRLDFIEPELIKPMDYLLAAIKCDMFNQTRQERIISCEPLQPNKISHAELMQKLGEKFIEENMTEIETLVNEITHELYYAAYRILVGRTKFMNDLLKGDRS